MSTSSITLARLKREIKALSPDDQKQVLEFVIRVARHRFKHLDKNHITRLILAIQTHSKLLVQREMQYANEKLGAKYDLNQWEVSHD